MAKVEGLDRWQRTLQRIPADAKREIQSALDEGGERVASLARTLAPVDDGDLKASIRSGPTPGRELSVTVQAGGLLTTRPVRKGITAPAFDYAAKIEHEEQPFFFPAYRALKRSIKASVNRAIKRAIGHAGGTGGASGETL